MHYAPPSPAHVRCMLSMHVHVRRFRLWVEPRRIRLHLPDDRLLVRGVAAGGSEDGAACGSGGALPAAAAGPIGNRHGHHHMAMGPLPPHRRGLIKTMITSVRRFKRARPDSEPGLVGSLARSAARGVALLFGGFAVGYLTAWREAQQAGFAAAASS